MEKKTRRRKPYTPPQPDTTLPRIFIKENQEFVLDAGVFIYNNTGSGMILTRVGTIEPSIISVSTVTP